MKRLVLFTLLTMLMSLSAFSHDIEVKNADGVTIYYNYITDGTELEVTYQGSDYYSYSNEYQGNVVIPEEVTYLNRTHKVTSIGALAFCECSRLTSVTIPNSVTSIGYRTFYQCSGLTSVTIGDSVTSIGGGFEYCSGLTSVTIPNSVTSIGRYAFNECKSLTSISVESGNKKYDSRNNCNAIIETASNTLIAGCKNTTIPNSVTSIGGSAFYQCSSLSSITIPNSVTSIGEWAFFGCSGLTSVTIPNSVTSIGYSAFYGCSGLTSIEIPNSVTSIGGSAFYLCSGLTSVTIGSGVVSIGYSAFDGADISTVISLIENPFKIEGNTYAEYRNFSQNTFNNATLYVPKGTIEKYKATRGWKDFAKIEEIDVNNIGIIIPEEEHSSSMYQLNGIKVNEGNLGKGIYIQNGKKMLVK